MISLRLSIRSPYLVDSAQILELKRGSVLAHKLRSWQRKGFEHAVLRLYWLIEKHNIPEHDLDRSDSNYFAGLDGSGMVVVWNYYSSSHRDRLVHRRGQHAHLIAPNPQRMVETSSLGMVQGDRIVYAGLNASLQELRARPHLLDYVFAWLPKDELTAQQHGQTELETAKKWFLSTKIPVVFGRRIDVACPYSISINLLRDSEANNTLDDRFYETSEYAEGWPDLTAPFVPDSYLPYSGLVIVPAATAVELVFAPGQVLVDRDGVQAVIREVIDAQTFKIDPNQHLELSGATVRGAYPPTKVTLRSAHFEEAFLVGCHAIGDQSKLLWLYSIVKFALLRGRRRYFEARGLDVSSISGSDFKESEFMDTSSQLGYSRYLTLQGKCLSTWPDDEAETIQAVTTSFTVCPKDGSEPFLLGE